jgi:hypothetical protein
LTLAVTGVATAAAIFFAVLLAVDGEVVSHAQPQATTAARAASTLVAICRTSAPGATAVAQAALQCRAIAGATPTPTRAAAQQGAPTPTPPALVVFAAPSVKTGLVGDIVAPAGVPLRGLYPPIFGDRVALGMDGLWDTTAGSRTGDGITSVTFTIVDQFDTVVHQVRTGRGDRFCAFGGSTPACRAWDFAANGWRWPSGQPVHSGRFRVFAFAQGDDPDHKGTWQADFEMRLARDGQQEVDGAVKLLGVVAQGGRYYVVYETLGFTPNWHGIRLRFYFDSADPARLGAGVREIPTAPDETLDGVFSSFAVQARPAAARAICAIAVQPDGSLILHTEDCAALP